MTHEMNPVFAKAQGKRAQGSGGTKIQKLDATEHARTDRADEYLELDKYSKDYTEAWAAKCCRSSYQSELKVKESDLVDEFGMKLVSAFMESAEEAAARGKMLHPDFLSYLVFVIRNDVVHHHSHVSRRAYQCLTMYLSRYPYAVFVGAGTDVGDDEDIPEGEGHNGAGKYPSVVVCPEAAWLPFFSNRGGFFHKALMSEDMSVAGQEYGREEYGGERHGPSRGSKTSRTSRGHTRGSMISEWKAPAVAESWSYVDEMLLCFTNRALESNDHDWNGDLLLFDYLVRVMRQDLDARMKVIRKIYESDEGSKASKPGEVASSLPVREMRALLENSAMWRMLLEMKFNAKLMKQMVHGLVQLVVDVSGGDEDELPTQEFELERDEEDDSPAGACAFSKAGLSSIASAFLGGMLDLFGMMERLGGFYALGSHRAASLNYRMSLDEYMVDSFWTEHGFCGELEDANPFLYSLKPRDALRFIGFVVADKFTKTFDESYVKTHYPECAESVQELFSAMHTLTVASRDVNNFFEIGVDTVLVAFKMDINRTVRMFKSADHVCLLMGAIASSLEKLLLDGEEIPTGKLDVAGIQAEVKKTIDALYDNEAATNSASRISSNGSMNLSLATLFVNMNT